ncbi:hypothetical protein FDECE_4297 [Fusarium decemcellulare]|nr:hypothetical protein FDECE_4297 [Fusarium decemcellulare]
MEEETEKQKKDVPAGCDVKQEPEPQPTAVSYPGFALTPTTLHMPPHCAHLHRNRPYGAAGATSNIWLGAFKSLYNIDNGESSEDRWSDVATTGSVKEDDQQDDKPKFKKLEAMKACEKWRESLGIQRRVRCQLPFSHEKCGEPSDMRGILIKDRVSTTTKHLLFSTSITSWTNSDKLALLNFLATFKPKVAPRCIMRVNINSSFCPEVVNKETNRDRQARKDAQQVINKQKQESGSGTSV